MPCASVFHVTGASVASSFALIRLISACRYLGAECRARSTRTVATPWRTRICNGSSHGRDHEEEREGHPSEIVSATNMKPLSKPDPPLLPPRTLLASIGSFLQCFSHQVPREVCGHGAERFLTRNTRTRPRPGRASCSARPGSRRGDPYRVSTQPRSPACSPVSLPRKLPATPEWWPLQQGRRASSGEISARQRTWLSWCRATIRRV